MSTVMWSFRTKHFTVQWIIEPDALSTEGMTASLARECREKIRSGEWECFQSEVRVNHSATGVVISEAYLSGSIYADPAEFRDHFGMTRKGRGSYFRGMVHRAIQEARKQYPCIQKQFLAVNLRPAIGQTLAA